MAKKRLSSKARILANCRKILSLSVLSPEARERRAKDQEEENARAEQQKAANIELVRVIEAEIAQRLQADPGKFERLQLAWQVNKELPLELQPSCCAVLRRVWRAERGPRRSKA